MEYYSGLVPRASATADIFAAVADSHRRDILVYLAIQERAVNEIAETVKLAQPSVSKHLKVLREAGLVDTRRDGRRVFYKTNIAGIRPLHEWAGIFERYWRHQLARIKERAEAHKGGKP